MCIGEVDEEKETERNQLEKKEENENKKGGTMTKVAD